jgi:hypothetical protein
MTKIVRSQDCGNSPKNQLVENLAVALSTGDDRAASGLITEEVQWEIVGSGTLRGRESVLQTLRDLNGQAIVQLTILHVVTHGKSGAVNGTVRFPDAERCFCDVFEFGNAKATRVSRIMSYRIDV